MKAVTALLTLCLPALLSGHLVMAQEYPTRHVSIINQTAAGSGPDVICRILSERLTRSWGQQVTVINKQGAAGLLAAQAAAGSPPDGYTLYMPTSTALVILPEIHPRTTIDFGRAFVPIGLVGETPMVIAVSSTLGINSLNELIAAVKATPGGLLYAANSRGSVPHLAGEYLRKQAGIELTFVSYPGAPAALMDVLGGRIPIIIESLSALAGTLQDGSIKALAVTSPVRLDNLSDLPTVAETLPGFAISGWFALLAPSGTPERIVHKIAADLQAALGEAEITEKFETLGVHVRRMSPSDTAEFIRREQQLWKPVIAQAGLAAK